jgi:hypothetical protein
VFRKVAAYCFAAVLSSSCAPAAATPSPSGATPPPSLAGLGQPATPFATPDGAAGWRSDLESLVPAMAAIHPNVTHSVPMATLEDAVRDVIATIPGATDDELMVGVLRIVAMVSAKGCDAHTGAFIWGTGTYPVTSLPLRLWLFPNTGGGDDVVVVDALPPYTDLIGARIDEIGSHSIADVLEVLEPIIPRDNDQTVRLLTPRYLLMPEVLRGLRVTDADSAVTLQVTHPGHDAAATVTPISMADYNAWAGPYGLHLPKDSEVEYLSRIDDVLWSMRLPDQETVFVQYNRMDRMPAGALDALRTELHGRDVRRVILDLRHNYGGEVSLVAPVAELFADPAIDRPGGLYVITGRNTFSAASLLVARLQEETGAVVVGEPMGGCPTAFGNSEEVSLPSSGIVVSVAGTLEVGVAAGDERPTIEPDIPVALTQEDWGRGSDPALGIITTSAP